LPLFLSQLFKVSLLALH